MAYDLRTIWKPKATAEFNMGAMDFERIDTIQKNIDWLSANVNSVHLPSLELMQHFYAELINLYDYFRPIINNANVLGAYDEKIKEGIELKRAWETSVINHMPPNTRKIFDFIDLCRYLKTELYFTKQCLGIGMPVKKTISTSEKIKRGIRGDTDLDFLPEV